MSDVNSEAEFEIRKEKAVAYGKHQGPGFLVFCGSTAMRNGSPVEKRNRPERDLLIDEGVLVADDDPDLLKFSRDYLFSSKSSAAGVVIDGNSNGAIWKPMSDLTSDKHKSQNLTRQQIEKAMNLCEELGEDGVRERYPHFGNARDYWVRSTRPRKSGPFPSKLIVAIVKKLPQLNGGWSTPESAAVQLHNSGYVIVDKEDNPAKIPEDRSFLISNADRIRLCALNYYIEAARERGDRSISINAGILHDQIGLHKNWPNVSQALTGQKFLKLANLSKPSQEGVYGSTSTIFTYRLDQTMSDEENMNPANPTNLILYGPPGTGKTYATAAEAVRLCDGHAPAGRTEVMKRYQQLLKSGQVRFITFHQSFSYEDFVEGLRPVQGNDEGETGFSLEPRHGVFRDIATVAELASKSGNRNTERLDLSGRDFYKMSLGRAKYDEHVYQGAIEEEYIVLGWGGEEDWSDARFDDSNEIRKRWKELGDEIDGGNNPISQLDRFRNQMQIGDIIVVSKGNHYFRAIGEITGPYYFEMAEDGIYNHRRSVRWLSVLDTELPVEAILEVKFSQQSCYSLNQKKLKLEALSRLIPGEDTGESGSAPDQFVLIIDEINRANISKVFGELITLLEPDKRLGEDGEIKLTLPYSGTSFGVPSNLHIIGTMNTADRSIALLDTALRRRFIFRELMPDPALLKEASVASKVDLVNFLMRINDRIEYLFDREHQIGHAYFMKCTSRVALDEVMRDKIIPLLAEYFYEDWGKLALVLGDTGKGDKFLQRTELKSPFPDTDNFSDPRLRWQVLEQFGPNAYKVV